MNNPKGLGDGGGGGGGGSGAGVRPGRGRGRGWLFTLLVVGMLVAHSDLWNWSKPDPLLLGFLPIGLWYHAVFSVGCAVLMWLLVKFAWPAHLEVLEEHRPAAGERRDEGGH